MTAVVVAAKVVEEKAYYQCDYPMASLHPAQMCSFAALNWLVTRGESAGTVAVVASKMVDFEVAIAATVGAVVVAEVVVAGPFVAF